MGKSNATLWALLCLLPLRLASVVESRDLINNEKKKVVRD